MQFITRIQSTKKIFKNTQFGKEMSTNEFKVVVNGGVDINIKENISMKAHLTFFPVTGGGANRGQNSTHGRLQL